MNEKWVRIRSVAVNSTTWTPLLYPSMGTPLSLDIYVTGGAMYMRSDPDNPASQCPMGQDGTMRVSCGAAINTMNEGDPIVYFQMQSPGAEGIAVGIFV